MVVSRLYAIIAANHAQFEALIPALVTLSREDSASQYNSSH